jgi:hypothetical protein
MLESKAVFRRMILGRLYDHLCSEYSFAWPRELFVDADLSLHDIDATLAFKSDIFIEELRIALDRIDEGTFGACLRCREDIPLALLWADPSRRFCSVCEQECSHISVPLLLGNLPTGN